MADAEATPHSTPRMDVFGSVDLLTPKAQPATMHAREGAGDSPPLTPLFTPVRATPSRAGSRRTQSIDATPRHLNGPSPLGPAPRRKRGEREREKIRAELDAAPGLTLDPRIAHDVLDLERRFAAASKGKSPARPPHRSHRPRHSLPTSHPPARTDHPALSPLPESANFVESDTSAFSHELVGPALPSSARSPSPPPPPQPLSEPEPPTSIKVDKPAYPALLPSNDSDVPSGSGTDKRTSKAAKRHSLTAMLGLGTRKKHKDEDDRDKLASPISLRPSPKRGDTHHTTRTFNTMLTTHTGATAGSIEPDRASNGRSVSATSSNPAFADSPVIEPSAKTLARAAATRDQLAKRYGMLYASLGDEGEERSTRSVSGSGSILKRASPGPSVESRKEPTLRARGLNPLEVVRWRSGVLQRARLSAGAARERTGEAWERETERRARDGFPAALGDSLPEANSLSWLPYLEPVFAEERAHAEGTGEFGTGGTDHRLPGMSAWYILASFVEGYVVAKDRDERMALEELGVRADGSFGSDGFKSVGSDPKSLASDVQAKPVIPDLHSHSKTITSDVRAQAIVNAAYARRGTDAHARRGTDAHALSDDASTSRFAAVGRALRGAGSRRNSVIVDGVRSRQGSVGPGATSEPPSPSHIPPAYLNNSPSNSQLSHPGARALGLPGNASWLVPKEGRPAHSRSHSVSRSISAGNPGLKPGAEFNPKPIGQGQGDGKSMSPASSRLNLANFVLGLKNMRRNGHGRQPLSKEFASGSENESARLSSDVSPSDADRRGGASDGEGGRVKRKRKTWRERENEKGAVPLSDGGVEVDAIDLRRLSLRTEKRVMIAVSAKGKAEGKKEGKEDEYARKLAVADDAHETLENVDHRLHNFTQVLSRLNTVHKQGADVFGEMFMGVPQEVVDILTPELSEDDRSSYTPSPTTPTLAPLYTFAKKLEGMEEIPTTVDHIGRSTLDASLPIAAFDTLHEFEHDLNVISRQIVDLRRYCEHAEDERQIVKQLYEHVAGNVGTTYPECSLIEQLLGSLVTEDMPWLPSWLPLWVRHLLELFSNQIQFMVENGLRIYGYVYAIVSVLIFPFTLVYSAIPVFVRFLRGYWWIMFAAGAVGVAYLQLQPEAIEYRSLWSKYGQFGVSDVHV